MKMPVRINRDGKEGRFDKRLEHWVERGISLGAKEFDQLLRHLPSVYPTAVVGTLVSLAAKIASMSIHLLG